MHIYWQIIVTNISFAGKMSLLVGYPIRWFFSRLLKLKILNCLDAKINWWYFKIRVGYKCNQISAESKLMCLNRISLKRQHLTEEPNSQKVPAHVPHGPHTNQIIALLIGLQRSGMQILVTSPAVRSPSNGPSLRTLPPKTPQNAPARVALVRRRVGLHRHVAWAETWVKPSLSRKDPPLR